MTVNLDDWRDALCWRMTVEYFRIKEQYRADEGWEGRREEWEEYWAATHDLLVVYESDLLRLRADELIEAREDEIGAAA